MSRRSEIPLLGCSLTDSIVVSRFPVRKINNKPRAPISALAPPPHLGRKRKKEKKKKKIESLIEAGNPLKSTLNRDENGKWEQDEGNKTIRGSGVAVLSGYFAAPRRHLNDTGLGHERCHHGSRFNPGGGIHPGTAALLKYLLPTPAIFSIQPRSGFREGPPPSSPPSIHPAVVSFLKGICIMGKCENPFFSAGFDLDSPRGSR